MKKILTVLSVVLLHYGLVYCGETATVFVQPEYVCHAVKYGEIIIDGNLEDTGWADAAVLTRFVDSRSEKELSIQCEVRMVWDDTNVYASFVCYDTDLVSNLKVKDDELWMEDAVEVFIDVDRDGMTYSEVEVNPLNTLYDSFVSDTTPGIDWAKDMRHIDFPKCKLALHTDEIKTATSFKGTLNCDTDIDEYWIVEILIPYSAMKDLKETPKKGSAWNANFYIINKFTKTSAGEYTAWSPTGSWFHVPNRFGKVIFAD